jgi:tripartite-type tricarboxylate transporter receptor subunit TctC
MMPGGGLAAYLKERTPVMAKMFRALLAVLPFGLLLCHPTSSQSAERDLNAWVKGKRLNIIVGFAAGGVNDLTARLIAQHGSRYFPGEPRIVVTNHPGGGGVRGVREAYKATPDGLTAGLLHPRFIVRPLIGQPIDGFDGSKIRLVGNIKRDPSGNLICIRRSVATTWDEVLALKRPITFADTDYGTSGGGGALFLQLIGAPIKVVTGYGGTAEILAAMDRGEADAGRSCLIAEGDTVERLYPEWLKPPTFIVAIASHGGEIDEARLHELKWAIPPSIFDLPGLTFSPGQREALELNDLLAATANHTVWLPPEVPDDMYKAWVGMLKKLEKDEAFIAQSKAAGQPVDFISGPEIRKIIQRAQNLPADGLATLRYLNTGK